LLRAGRCAEAAAWAVEPHAAIAGDEINPALRLWYAPREAPILEHQPVLLLNQVLYEPGG
jgi:hypothetical protein